MIKKAPLAESLIKTPLFSSMDGDTASFFADRSHKKEFENGHELFAMGDHAKNFYYIINGWVKLYRLSRDGEETVIHVIAPGETFAEAAVFSPLQRYPVSAQAVENTTVLEIPRELFVEKIKENSDFALSILGAISARQRYLIQQIEQLTVKEAPQRLGIFLLQLQPVNTQGDLNITLPYDKSLIARRLNIQPETFSRALKKLESHGVTNKGREIAIHDPSELARYCDIEFRDKPC